MSGLSQEAFLCVAMAAKAIALEAIGRSFDKFSTQNRRTKKTTKPALTAKKRVGLPNSNPDQTAALSARGRRLMRMEIVFGSILLISRGKSFGNSRGVIACGT